MKAIVTGGLGFIGSSLVAALKQMPGADVTVIDNLYGGHARMVASLGNLCVPVQNVDVVDILTVDASVFDGVDWMFHFAGHYANELSLREPMRSVRTNVEGTMACLEACRTYGIKNFCYASSSGVYGNGNGEGIFSESSPPKPNTPYEVGKYAGELLALGYGDIYDMGIVCPRFFNVYGRGDVSGEWRAVVPNFFKKALRGETLVVTGAEASRDFSEIGDVIRGILAGVDKVERDGGGSLVYNISTGQEVKILELAQIIIGLVRSDSMIKVESRRVWDNALRRAGDPTHYRTLFPEISASMLTIEEGLEKHMEWYTDVCE